MQNYFNNGQTVKSRSENKQNGDRKTAAGEPTHE